MTGETRQPEAGPAPEAARRTRALRGRIGAGGRAFARPTCPGASQSCSRKFEEFASSATGKFEDREGSEGRAPEFARAPPPEVAAPANRRGVSVRPWED
ncbi:hypothetical protein AKJ41_01280 [candidate division MSBL1 archaeon SCGC-AAA259O05]|uniref:Uncharacterized protein n=1 Tax=candidate division MSBL1 archaeon SCGC-AAA259O05 TaxID=1698271 RepID=A0A133V4X6_9EURY|nr:hypothetical protein AKJ41_01280 [candidate division MSBL1 archaeon SCGC-AAA259O05]